MRLAAVSEALTLLEDVAILPRLHNVAESVQVDVEQRAEVQARVRWDNRVERMWRSKCKVRPGARFPMRRQSRGGRSLSGARVHCRRAKETGGAVSRGGEKASGEQQEQQQRRRVGEDGEGNREKGEGKGR
ncbi:unnamed protein product, partial [Scytosiphon promiscuus]